MPFKTVLSIVGVDQGDGDLNRAAQLCAESGAHLTALVMGFAPTPPVTEFGLPVTEPWILASQEDVRRLQARAAAIGQFLDRLGISGEALSEYPDAGIGDDIVGHYGRYSDLIVVGPELSSDPRMRSKVLEGALFSSGRPVLVLSAEVAPTLAPKRVLVGWDSGLEAARAVRESLEILEKAEQVTIAIVDPQPSLLGHGEEPGADIASYLARHGVRVTVSRLPREGRSTAEILRRHAIDTNADLMVLGAYGHSRLRDWIFGGVTKSMVTEPPVPVLMAR